MTSDSPAFPTPAQLVDKVPLIRNPGFWVPQPVDLPPDIHPLPDDVHAYFVYPHSLEAHVLSTVPSSLQQLQQAHQQRLALLASYAESKERARKAQLNRVAPGYAEGGAALEPVRKRGETVMPAPAPSAGTGELLSTGGTGDENRGGAGGRNEGNFLGDEAQSGSPTEMGQATLDRLQRDQMMDFVEGLERLDTTLGTGTGGQRRAEGDVANLI